MRASLSSSWQWLYMIRHRTPSCRLRRMIKGRGLQRLFDAVDFMDVNEVRRTDIVAIRDNGMTVTDILCQNINIRRGEIYLFDKPHLLLRDAVKIVFKKWV